MLVLFVSAYLYLCAWWGNYLFMAVYSGGAVVIAAACFRRRRSISSFNLVPAALLLLYYTHIPDRLAASLTYLKTTATYDGFLLYVDRSFGFSPSILVSHWVGNLHLSPIFFGIYIALSIAIGASFAAHVDQGNPPWKIVFVLLSAVIVGVLCYNLLPACGPRMLLGANEFNTGDPFVAVFPPGAQPVMLAVAAKYPRNAMPSLHMTWALLVLWICRDLKRGYLLAGGFAFLTAVATLAVGEHYLVDLVVAFPFALAVWSLCIGDVPLSHPKRVLTIIVSASTYLAWIIVIRFAPNVFYISPVIPWLASAVTIAGTLLAVHSQPTILFTGRHPDVSAQTVAYDSVSS